MLLTGESLADTETGTKGCNCYEKYNQELNDYYTNYGIEKWGITNGWILDSWGSIAFYDVSTTKREVYYTF